MKEKKWEEVIIGLGSNLCSPVQQLICAKNSIIKLPKTKLIAVSNIYQSKSWGFEGKDFHNACLLIQTQLQAIELLAKTQEIEKKLGKTTQNKLLGYQDRVIDIDLLEWENHKVISPELELPHPYYYERLFTLIPTIDFIDRCFLLSKKQFINQKIKSLRETSSLSVCLLNINTKKKWEEK